MRALPPVGGHVGGKAGGIAVAQLALGWHQRTAPTHDVKDRLRTILAHQDDAVDLARFERVAGHLHRRLRRQDAAAIALVGAFRARGQVHGFAYHRVAHQHIRADAADQRFAGGGIIVRSSLGRARVLQERALPAASNGNILPLVYC